MDAPGEGELRLSGPRVMIAESKAVIVPWSESIRYGIKKNGYHGGVAPQEMVTPIAVLAPSDAFPEGWVDVPVDVPLWWEEPAAAPVVTAKVPARTKPPKPEQTGLLFDMEEENVKERKLPCENRSRNGMVATLFRSPIFEQQKKLAGRSVPPEEILRSVFSALDQRGGRMTSAALARTVNYPPMRLRGLLAVMQRVLNIDGFAVLTRDEASDTVESESGASEASVRPEVKTCGEYQSSKARPDHRCPAPGDRPPEQPRCVRRWAGSFRGRARRGAEEGRSGRERVQGGPRGIRVREDVLCPLAGRSRPQDGVCFH